MEICEMINEIVFMAALWGGSYVAIRGIFGLLGKLVK